MVLLGDEAQVRALFDRFADSDNLDARLVHSLRRMYYRLRNRFGRYRWNSEVTWVMWNLVLICLVTMLVSEQDRCTVCDKHTIDSEIILDARDGTPR